MKRLPFLHLQAAYRTAGLRVARRAIPEAFRKVPATRRRLPQKPCSTARPRALTRRCVELALGGDTVALRLCLERLLPPRRDRPVTFEMPSLNTAADAAEAAAALTRAVAEGDLTPGEASELGRLLEAYAKILEARDFEERLVALESRLGSTT